MESSNALRGLRVFFRKIFDVREGEWAKTSIMAFYFFSIIAANWMIKAVRNTLVLEEFGAGFFRYLYIIEGFYLILVASVFAACSKRVSRKTLFMGVFSVMIASLILFWFLFRNLNVPFLSAALYLFSSSFGIMMTTQFFILANDIFDTSQGKGYLALFLALEVLGICLGVILLAFLYTW